MVCPILYCRDLAVMAHYGRGQCAAPFVARSDTTNVTSPNRRFHHLCRDWYHCRWTFGVCVVLPTWLLRRKPDGHHQGLAGRHGVSWWLGRCDPSRLCVFQNPKCTDWPRGRYGGIVCSIGLDVGSIGQFHQCRTLGAAHRYAMGRYFPRPSGTDLWGCHRAMRAPSIATVPSHIRRSGAGSAVGIFGIQTSGIEKNWPDYGCVFHRLRNCTQLCRAVPPTRRTISKRGQPDRLRGAIFWYRPNHGAIVINPHDRTRTGFGNQGQEYMTPLEQIISNDI